MKNLKNKLKNYLLLDRNRRKIKEIQEDDEFEKNRIAAELIRNTHSIEKGLSINNPRLGFGHSKQKEMMGEINELKKSQSNYHQEVIKMAIGALVEYIEFHKEKKYKDEFIEKINDFLNENSMYIDTIKYGGTMTLLRSEMKFNIEEIEKFFNTRHSIRDFEDTEVNNEDLKKALRLAQRTPSACNRQGVRAYVVQKDKIRDLNGWIEGIGGFSDSVNKYILITAKVSTYRQDENYQYIVSASMYVAYLTLTLHLYGLGACVVQRPVIYSKKWDNLRKKWEIPKDEQIICLLGVGNLKESCKVPVSHRLENSEMIKFL